MKKINLILFFYLIFFVNGFANDKDFNNWKITFQKLALSKGVSKKTLDNYFMNSKFLPNVIKYDRYQPEFYEDTNTYINKRTSKKKVSLGKKLYHKNQIVIDEISEKFSVDKNLLLSLMGIETNFGSYLGKMDIISSLATLSFDKRRSEFFSSELIILLKLIDNELVNPKILYGSWAGAFGNFQFMPSTLNDYAFDYDKNGSIDLKGINDSFASAANYLNRMGWNNKQPCFIKINLKSNIPDKYLNTSAKKIKNEERVKFFMSYIEDNEILKKYSNFNSAIVTPDFDIVDNADKHNPAYIVFDNYKLILKWNRSLRFGLAVCTLKNYFNNEL